MVSRGEDKDILILQDGMQSLEKGKNILEAFLAGARASHKLKEAKLLGYCSEILENLERNRMA